jgi:hypothetical protein
MRDTGLRARRALAHNEPVEASRNADVRRINVFK